MGYRYWTFAVIVSCGSAFAQPAAKAERHDMELVGSHDLQGRSAYQPLVHRQGDRWIAYIGHHGGLARNPLSGAEEPNGTSILDVTDPESPRYLAHIPGEAGKDEAGGAPMGGGGGGPGGPQGGKREGCLVRQLPDTARAGAGGARPAEPGVSP